MALKVFKPTLLLNNFFRNSRRYSSREEKHANISIYQECLFRTFIGCSLKNPGRLRGLPGDRLQLMFTFRDHSINKRASSCCLIWTTQQNSVNRMMTRWGSVIKAAEGQIICQRSHSSPEAEPGLGSSLSSARAGSWPSHFPLQHQSQESKSGARGPGLEEDRIPWADLWGGGDIQVQPLPWTRWDSLQRYRQVSSSMDVLWVLSWVDFSAYGKLRFDSA